MTWIFNKTRSRKFEVNLFLLMELEKDESLLNTQRKKEQTKRSRTILSSISSTCIRIQERNKTFLSIMWMALGSCSMFICSII
jgi:ribosome maturation protein Sdo1